MAATSASLRPAPPAWLVEAARDTGTLTAELRLVPNQPIVFKDDPARKAALGGRLHRLHVGQVPAHRRRALAGPPADDEERRARDGCGHRIRRVPAGGGIKVGRFVVSGASKRGWTTWTTAAVDPRVIAIAPAVIDMLNVEPSFVHHYRAYGAWSEAVKDYVAAGHHGLDGHAAVPQR